MSTNIHMIAKRNITFKMGDGSVGSEVQERYIDVWQTSSETTRGILKAADPIQAYKDWVIGVSSDEQEPVFAEDDIFGEHEPIGFNTINRGRGHCDQLSAEIEHLQRRGFTVEVEAW